MPSIVFVRGGPYHTAAGAPLAWEISKQPGLDEEGPYVFYPGVPVEVSARDAAWLMDPNNTRERVFELVGKRRQDPPAGTPAPSAPADSPPSPPAPSADLPVEPRHGHSAEPAAGKPGPQTGPTRP
jgi:hypothetical protein